MLDIKHALKQRENVVLIRKKYVYTVPQKCQNLFPAVFTVYSFFTGIQNQWYCISEDAQLAQFFNIIDALVSLGPQTESFDSYLSLEQQIISYRVLGSNLK